MPVISDQPEVISELYAKFGQESFVLNSTANDITSLWIGRDRITDILKYLKTGIDKPYRMLYDLTAIDERTSRGRDDQPEKRFYSSISSAFI